MSIIVTCECGKSFRTEDRFAGMPATCPSCGRKLTVPGAAGPSGHPEEASRVKDYAHKLATTEPPADAGPTMEAAAASGVGGGSRPPEPPNSAFFTGSSQQPKPKPAPKPVVPRRSMMEILLDPRSIQWMLTLSGALMVLGLIILLASFPFFKRPEVLAGLMSAGTLIVLGMGWFGVLKTRYKVAGEALAFLACVLMPLNLWFYHSQNLITLHGHLWLAAAVCCLLYAATAFALRDPLFMYAVEGGVTLTMLLLLADLNKASELTTLSLSLLVLGLVSIHAERAFSPEEGQFTRRRFGLPLFWSGHAQLGVGLLILLVAQIMAWLQLPVHGIVEHDPGSYFSRFHMVKQTPGIFGYEWNGLIQEGFPFLPVALWIAGVYAYLYSDIVVRRIGVYTFVAAFCVLMAEVTVIGWEMPSAPAMIAILAGTALAANILWFFLSDDFGRIRRAVAPLGVALSALPLLLGVVLHMRATSSIFDQWKYETTWWFVAAMALVAVTSRVSAFLYRKEKFGWGATYFFFSAAALLIAAAGLLTMLDLREWSQQSVLLMIIPILYMLASYFWRGHSPERPLAWVAHAATGVLLFHVVCGALESFDSFVRASHMNLWYGLFFAEAAVFYALTAAVRKRGANIYLSAAMAAGAIWQLLAYNNVAEQYYAMVFALLGLALLLFYRVAGKESFESKGIALPAFQCGNTALTAAFVAQMLQGLARLATSRANRTDLFVAALTTVVSLLAAWLVRVTAWKRWYITTTIALGGLTFILVNFLSVLTPWQKLEVFCVAVGLGMLVVGFIGHWREETAKPNELISLGLWLGSALATLPILIAVIYFRFDAREISMWNELSLLTISIVMVFLGYIMQFKAPTLIGGAALVAQLAIMVIFVGMQQQVALGVYLAVGGGAVFAVGVCLAIYREKLLLLPDQVAKREGVFRIFGWR